MKYKFGRVSLGRLDTCHPALQYIMKEALSYGVMDFTIVEGHRPKEKQEEYYRTGKSKVQFPKGKHNKIPSLAVDIAPWINGSISWNKFHCCILNGIILSAASKLGIKLRWGGNWDMDEEPITDQDFQDLVHYELVD